MGKAGAGEPVAAREWEIENEGETRSAGAGSLGGVTPDFCPGGVGADGGNHCRSRPTIL